VAPQYILAWDLGTSGNKASLYDAGGRCLAATFVPYQTQYPTRGWHEQRPLEWWDAVVESTAQLLESAEVDRRAIAGCGISGHSLGVVPLDGEGKLLRALTPIWSDARAADQAQSFFQRTDERAWYLATGNGFPPPLYSVFKVMWYRDNEPGMFGRIDKVIGTKDFINYKLTGTIVTDHSYASGSGVYDLLEGSYSESLIAAADLPRTIFPEIVPSTAVIGGLTIAAAAALSLPKGLPVVAGGVDNSCMALGARNVGEGRVYNSLGSSSWIAVSSGRPVLDEAARPYVFAHVVPGMFTSAVSIFSAGTRLRWVRDQVCENLVARAISEGTDAYDLMTALAEQSPPGANRLLFNPSLAGGTALDASPNVRGAYVGLDLRHTQADMIRAAMEGVALGLRLALDVLRGLSPISPEMVVVGGGSRVPLWRRILADVLDITIVKTNIDQQAAALGAMAVAAVGSGLWSDFAHIDEVHEIEDTSPPVPENRALYERLLPIYARAAEHQAEIGGMLASLGA
jgi:xylulokinase